MRCSLFWVATAVAALGAACAETTDGALGAGTGGTGGGTGSMSSGGGQGGGGTGCMSDTDAGSGQPAGTIGDVVPAIMGIAFDVNRSDGFVTPVRSDVWFVDVAAATVTLNDGAPVSAGVEQVQALVRALAASAYRIRQSCCIYEFVDGYPNSPVIAVSDGLTNHLFGVGDSPCWRTANAFEGEVIGCADFGAIFASLEAIAPSATPFQCRWYL